MNTKFPYIVTEGQTASSITFLSIGRTREHNGTGYILHVLMEKSTQ